MKRATEITGANIANIANITDLRLHSQHIAGSRLGYPEEVVRKLWALQAQDYLQALWAIGLRTERSSAADIERAIEERKILRTWPIRVVLQQVKLAGTRAY